MVISVTTELNNVIQVDFILFPPLALDEFLDQKTTTFTFIFKGISH